MPTATQSSIEVQVHELEEEIGQERAEAEHQYGREREDLAVPHDERANELAVKLEALKQEAGLPSSHEDPAADSEAAEKRDEENKAVSAEIIVSGIEMPYAKLGGKPPTHGSLKLSGGKVALAQGTAFKKGQTIHFSGTAVIKDVGTVDTHDSATQTVSDTEQRHVARIIALDVQVPTE